MKNLADSYSTFFKKTKQNKNLFDSQHDFTYIAVFLVVYVIGVIAIGIIYELPDFRQFWEISFCAGFSHSLEGGTHLSMSVNVHRHHLAVCWMVPRPLVPFHCHLLTRKY